MATALTTEATRGYALQAGADVFGIAGSDRFGAAPAGFHPTDVLPECRSVIVLGATFPAEVLGDGAEYTASRNAMLSAMTRMAKDVAKRLKPHGCKTKVISAAGGKWVESGEKKEQYGEISLKHAAQIAGLGTIGKNNLLTHPQYGNLLWFSAILTDAVLTPGETAQFSLCDGCNLCVEACPAGALSDPATFGRKGCARFFTIEHKKFLIKCFACRAVCPHRAGWIRR